MIRRCQHRSRRCGYTLTEMVIVVAVLMTVLSLGWPALRKLSRKTVLEDAAAHLRVELARARLDAIEGGAARMFRYQPQTGCFFVAEMSTAEESDASPLVPLVPVGQGGAVPGAHSEGLPAVGESGADQAYPERLPGGVCFVEPGAPDAPVSAEQPTGSAGEAAWSPPIVFYPNGRTLNARLRLASPGGYYIDVALRGLTGTVQTGEVGRFDVAADEPAAPPPEESP